jgi:hypothetical protein
MTPSPSRCPLRVTTVLAALSLAAVVPAAGLVLPGCRAPRPDARTSQEPSPPPGVRGDSPSGLRNPAGTRERGGTATHPTQPPQSALSGCRLSLATPHGPIDCDFPARCPEELAALATAESVSVQPAVDPGQPAVDPGHAAVGAAGGVRAWSVAARRSTPPFTPEPSLRIELSEGKWSVMFVDGSAPNPPPAAGCTGPATLPAATFQLQGLQVRRTFAP